MRWLAAVVACIALSLSACSGDPEPVIVAPTPTPSASETPSAEPSETVEPLTPREQERALIEAWVAAFSESISTGDPEPWLALSDPRCQNCQVFAQNLRSAYANGGRIEGGSWTLERARFRQNSESGAVWDFDVRQSEERWLDGDGRLVKRVPAGVNPFAAAILRSDMYVLRGIEVRGS
jgi:hypothetical protein